MTQIPANATKDKLLNEFNTVVAETEQLIRTAAGAGSDTATALKTTLDNEFSAASERLARIRDDAISQANAVASTTHAYVQDNPWRSVGIVAALAAATGLIAGLLISRRP